MTDDELRSELRRLEAENALAGPVAKATPRIALSRAPMSDAPAQQENGPPWGLILASAAAGAAVLGLVQTFRRKP